MAQRQPASRCSSHQFNAEFVNALQEEIANAIENAGINLNPEDNQQLLRQLVLWLVAQGKIESVDALRQLKVSILRYC